MGSDLDAGRASAAPGGMTDDPASPGAPTCSLLVAFLLCSFFPRTTAIRTQGVSLRRAYAYHVLTCLMAVVIVFVIVAWVETPHDNSLRLLRRATVDFYDVASDFRRTPLVMSVATTAIVLSLELGFVLLAALAAPWGALIEPLRHSLGNALRRTWLQTPHVLLACVLWLLLAGVFEHASDAWRSRTPSPMARVGMERPDRPPPELPKNADAWRDYYRETERFQQAYHMAWEQWRREQPWYDKYDEALLAYTSFSLAAWVLAGVLRGIATRRAGTSFEEAPRCEACGYNLTATPLDSRCPECGKPAVESLGPDARPGTPWERRSQRGRLRAYWATTVEAVRRPTSFGFRVPVHRGMSDARLFLLLHVPAFFLVGSLGVIAPFLGEKGSGSLAHQAEIFWGLGPLVGYVTAICGFVLPFLLAWICGAFIRSTRGRSVLAPAFKIMCYLSGALLLWMIGAAVTVNVVIRAADRFNTYGQAFMIDGELLAFAAWNTFCGLTLLPYVFCAFRAAVGTRFANR